MSLTRYGYSNAIHGFFEFPTDNARRILPREIEPVEVHHGTSILSMTCFDFTESEVGAYGEVVMAVIVAPLVSPEEKHPKSAFFPFLVATTTKAAREHAIERWHLPHWMDDVQMSFTPGEGSLTARVSLAGEPIGDLTVSEHSWAPITHLYQAFMKDDSGSYMARMTFDGLQSEHENETGILKLYDHPFNAAVEIAEVYERPFRELWNKDGIQTFDPLVKI